MVKGFLAKMGKSMLEAEQDFREWKISGNMLRNLCEGSSKFLPTS